MDVTAKFLLITIAVSFLAGAFVGYDFAMSVVAKREALVAWTLKKMIGGRR